MTYLLRVSANTSDENSKHIELLKDGEPVGAQFFPIPLNLEQIGSLMIDAYSTPPGLYTLNGERITVPPEEPPLPSTPEEEEPTIPDPVPEEEPPLPPEEGSVLEPPTPEEEEDPTDAS